MVDYETDGEFLYSARYTDKKHKVYSLERIRDENISIFWRETTYHALRMLCNPVCVHREKAFFLRKFT